MSVQPTEFNNFGDLNELNMNNMTDFAKRFFVLDYKDDRLVEFIADYFITGGYENFYSVIKLRKR